MPRIYRNPIVSTKIGVLKETFANKISVKNDIYHGDGRCRNGGFTDNIEIAGNKPAKQGKKSIAYRLFEHLFPNKSVVVNDMISIYAHTSIDENNREADQIDGKVQKEELICRNKNNDILEENDDQYKSADTTCTISCQEHIPKFLVCRRNDYQEDVMTKVFFCEEKYLDDVLGKQVTNLKEPTTKYICTCLGSTQQHNVNNTRQHEEDQLECPICFEIFELDSCIFKCPVCNYFYCERCKWTDLMNSCPVCENDISVITCRDYEREKGVREFFS